LAIAAVFLVVVVAPIVFFYIRPNFEKFQNRTPGNGLLLMIFTGVWAQGRKTEKSWRTVLSIIALLDFICGLLLLYVALFMY
jgi:hypothetical protein